MADFKNAIQYLLMNEGGYVNDLSDKGGATNYGISLRLLHALGEFGDFDGDGDIDKDDIRSMTLENARTIYRKSFWDLSSYDLINDDLLAAKVFDFSVNMGTKRAHILLQKSANQEAKENLLLLDGILGSNTITVINKQNPNSLIRLLASNVAAYYLSIVEKDFSQVKFLKGWLNRAYKNVF